MHPKYLVFIIGLAAIVTGCNKAKDISLPDNTTPQVTSVVPIPYFSVSNVLQSNMVVQRDKPFLVWGQATPGRQVSVAVSWNKSTFSAISDSKGNWNASIPATGANAEPQTITCSSEGVNDIAFNNILIGDVWVCSGQSNMVMPVDVLPPSFSGVLNYQDEIAAANYPDIRVLSTIPDYQSAPLNEFTHKSNWVVCSPQSVGALSAVAYFFARKLNTTLNIPIGIIISAVNGTSCHLWANKDAFYSDPILKPYALSTHASALFNGMINPLTHLGGIKGFLWYQGENNEHNNLAQYTKLNSALIYGWRAAFNQGTLPFYFVQLTPFAEDYNNTNPPGGNPVYNNVAKFREAQANILAVPNTGMAVTMDVGEPGNHHPRDKKPVGERLALLALKNTYHQDVICNGPRYASLSINNNTVTVNFVNGTADGLTTKNNNQLNQLFYIAGTDRIFRQGTATIQGNTVVIIAPTGTPLPIQAVRYAFTNAPLTNLQNAAGLPAEPFRTDNWEE